MWGTRKAIHQAVLGGMLLLAITACEAEPTLGTEVDVRVSVWDWTGGGVQGSGTLGVTPVSVRKGGAADLKSLAVPPIGTPYYVRVKFVNKSDFELSGGIRMQGTDSEGRDLMELDLSELDRFPPCPQGEGEDVPLGPGESVIACVVLVTPPGTSLEELYVPNASWDV